MMKTTFVFVAFQWPFFTIFLPEVAHGAKETIESGNMKDLFQKGLKFREGDGDMWTLTRGNYIETCSNDGDFGFVTRKIHIKDASVNVIYITMETEFFMDRINQSFGIYIHKGLTEPPSTIKDPNSFSKNFSLVYTIHEISSKNNKSNKRWTHSFKFNKNGSNDLILGARGTGVCAIIYSMRVYYYYCEEEYFKGVKLPKTISPSEGWKKVEVNCSMLNSSPSYQDRTLSGFCGYHGRWNISRNMMGCFCKKGFEQNASKHCSPCPKDHFKAIPSNKTCKLCPYKSTNTVDRTSCQCIQGYHHHPRITQRPTESPCFGLIKSNLNLSVEVIDERRIKVTWKTVVVEEQLRDSLHYDVECLLCSDERNCNKLCKNEKYKPKHRNLTQPFTKISDLHPGRRYVVRVYPKTVINTLIDKKTWNYSEKMFVLPTKSERPADDKMSHFDYVVVSGIAVGVLFMIMVVLLIVVIKRKSEYRRHEITGYPNQVELPCTGQKLYVDPTNYDSPQDALNEFACELDPSMLVLEKLIGGGEFGDVYKGIIKCKGGKSFPVAVKTLKNDHNEKNAKDFLLEASVMGQFHDPNVIHLEGVITKIPPSMIITEYMSNGSLDRFLRLNDDNLTNLQLTGMARGVASGMTYLSAMNFIHRDLAARNILVNDDLLCKISDFGLSRSLETAGSDGEYATSGGKIPVRWTAPEAITHRKFSSSSDVWSFGILLWEIMSFGDRPYWEWDNLKVLKEVEEGFRLPPPLNCPPAVHNMMLMCWKTDRNERPKFKYITQVINEWIRSPETMNDKSNLDTVIGEWLTSIKMGNYASLFTTAGYNSPYQLKGIGEEDLKKLGVKLIGHRNKILKAVKAIKDTETGDKVMLTRGGSIAI